MSSRCSYCLVQFLCSVVAFRARIACTRTLCASIFIARCVLRVVWCCVETVRLFVACLLLLPIAVAALIDLCANNGRDILYINDSSLKALARRVSAASQEFSQSARSLAFTPSLIVTVQQLLRSGSRLSGRITQAESDDCSMTSTGNVCHAVCSCRHLSSVTAETQHNTL